MLSQLMVFSLSSFSPFFFIGKESPTAWCELLSLSKSVVSEESSMLNIGTHQRGAVENLGWRAWLSGADDGAPGAFCRRSRRGAWREWERGPQWYRKQKRPACLLQMW